MSRARRPSALGAPCAGPPAGSGDPAPGWAGSWPAPATPSPRPCRKRCQHSTLFFRCVRGRILRAAAPPARRPRRARARPPRARPLRAQAPRAPRTRLLRARPPRAWLLRARPPRTWLLRARPPPAPAPRAGRKHARQARPPKARIVCLTIAVDVAETKVAVRPVDEPRYIIEKPKTSTPPATPCP